MELQDIVAKAAKKYADDIEKAVAYAVQTARKQDWFEAMIDKLVTSAIRSMIGDARHMENVAMRRDSREYGGPAKVTAGKASARVASDYFNYNIASKTLGAVLGEELEAIAASESERAEGHEFNARLCRALKPLVADGKTVAQCVKAGKLASIFKELQNGRGTAVA